MKNKILLGFLCLLNSKLCFNSSLVRFDTDRIIATLHFLASIEKEAKLKASVVSDLAKEAIHALRQKQDRIDSQSNYCKNLGIVNIHSDVTLVPEIDYLINTWKLVDIAALSIKNNESCNLVLPTTLATNLMQKPIRNAQKVEMVIYPSTSTAEGKKTSHFTVTYPDQNNLYQANRKSAFTVIRAHQATSTTVRIAPDASLNAMEVAYKQTANTGQ